MWRASGPQYQGPASQIYKFCFFHQLVYFVQIFVLIIIIIIIIALGIYSVRQKKVSPKVICHFLSNRSEFLHEISHVYYSFIIT